MHIRKESKLIIKLISQTINLTWSSYIVLIYFSSDFLSFSLHGTIFSWSSSTEFVESLLGDHSFSSAADFSDVLCGVVGLLRFSWPSILLLSFALRSLSFEVFDESSFSSSNDIFCREYLKWGENKNQDHEHLCYIWWFKSSEMKIY